MCWREEREKGEKRGIWEWEERKREREEYGNEKKEREEKDKGNKKLRKTFCHIKKI